MESEPPNETARKPVPIDLALQCGGSHGAFTWGVLDRLLGERILARLAHSEPLPTRVFLPGQAPAAEGYILMLNERIRAAAAAQGATVVDIEAIVDDLRWDPANFHDCNHLSARGNERAADVWYRTISVKAE